jgi:DNA-binding NtrC family response regulator
MARCVLVVSGSDSDREGVQKALDLAGYQTDGVTNGADAFEQLMALPYDLVLADCCLDKLDCVAMVHKVRGRGVKTPILVWTANPENPALAEILKATGGEFVAKSAAVDQVVAKVDGILSGGVAVPTHVPTPEVSATIIPPPQGGVLLIDDRAGEGESLHALLPPSTHFASCETPNQGQALAHKHKFDLVLFSADTSATNLTGTIAQLHLLVPEGFIVGVATAVRGQDPQVAVKALRDLDFDEVILKPFKAENVHRLVARYCSSWDELVVVSDDVVRASARCSRKENYKEFVATIKGRLEEGVKGLIDACFDRAVVDLTAVDSLSPMDMGEALRRLKTVAAPFGLSVRFVVSPALILVLRKFEKSFGWEPFDLYPSVEAARAAKA